jgi:hypothetical protein
VFDVVSKLGEEIEDFLNSVRGLGVSGKLDERLNHWSIDVKFGKMGQRLDFFSDFFNFTFKLDPTATHLKIVNNSEGFTKSVDSFLMFSLANSVISSLLGSKSGTVSNSLGQESDILDSRGQLRLGFSKETLSIDNSLLTLSLGSGVGVSVVGGGGDFSVTGNEIFIMLSISVGLLRSFLSNEVIDREITSSANNRDSHAASQAQCEQTVVDTQGLLAEAESELASTIENIAFLTQAIADGTALRAQQAADYAISQAKHQKAIDALGEALRIINNL